MSMKEIELLRKIRHTKEKTYGQTLLLDYDTKLSTISEILVSVSKWHISSEDGIQEIRDVFIEGNANEV